MQQRDSVNNAKNNWNSSIEFRKQAELEAKTGRTPPFQVDQAKQRELVAYNGYVSAMQNYEQSLDQFKITIDYPTNASLELDQNELLALRNTAIMQPQYSVDVAIETALFSGGWTWQIPPTALTTLRKSQTCRRRAWGPA